MSLSRTARAALVALARAELPEPGDPRLLADALREAGVAGPEALEILARTTLAHTQLRDLRLERAWQSGFGWFLARNLIVFGALALVLFLALRPSPLVLDGALTGAALYFLLCLALAPRRLAGHRHRRAGILAAYGKDLSGYLDGLVDR